MGLFKNNIYQQDEPIKAGSKKVKVQWELSEDADASKIERFKPSCGCTVVPTIDGRIVTGYYNDSTTRDKVKKSGGTATVTKNITVYYKDGEDAYVVNSRGVKQKNTNKMSEVISFHLKVVE